MQRLEIILNWINEHYWNIVFGLLISIINYFTEIKGSVNVMLFVFLIDLVLGIWASTKLDKKRFSTQKFFIAIVRALVSVVFIAVLFSMGKEMHIGSDLYNYAAWLVTGFILFSAAENAYRLTGGKYFLVLKKLLAKKIEENTGVDITQESQTNPQ